MPDSDPLLDESRAATGTLLSHLLGNMHGALDTGTALAISGDPHAARRFIAECGDRLEALLRAARSLAAPLRGGATVDLYFQRAERACGQFVLAASALTDEPAASRDTVANDDDPDVRQLEDACRAAFAAVAELARLLNCNVSYFAQLDPARRAYYDDVYARLRKLRREAPPVVTATVA